MGNLMSPPVSRPLDLDVVGLEIHFASHALPYHEVQVVFALTQSAPARIRHVSHAITMQLTGSEQIGRPDGTIQFLRLLPSDIGAMENRAVFFREKVDPAPEASHEFRFAEDIDERRGKVEQSDRFIRQERSRHHAGGGILGPADRDGSHRPLGSGDYGAVAKIGGGAHTGHSEAEQLSQALAQTAVITGSL